MKQFAIGLLVACGGGPSIDVTEPTAVIVSTNCMVFGQTQYSAQATIQVTLQVGQAISPEFQFFGGGASASLNEFVGCGGWQPFGNDTCVREIGLPPTVTVLAQRDENTGGAPLPVPFTLSVTANPLDAPGSFTIGNGDFEDITCN